MHIFVSKKLQKITEAQTIKIVLILKNISTLFHTKTVYCLCLGVLLKCKTLGKECFLYSNMSKLDSPQLIGILINSINADQHKTEDLLEYKCSIESTPLPTPKHSIRACGSL